MKMEISTRVISFRISSMERGSLPMLMAISMRENLLWIRCRVREFSRQRMEISTRANLSRGSLKGRELIPILQEMFIKGNGSKVPKMGEVRINGQMGMFIKGNLSKICPTGSGCFFSKEGISFMKVNSRMG
jgi:hypothetical protein